MSSRDSSRRGPDASGKQDSCCSAFAAVSPTGAESSLNVQAGNQSRRRLPDPEPLDEYPGRGATDHELAERLFPPRDDGRV